MIAPTAWWRLACSYPGGADVPPEEIEQYAVEEEIGIEVAPSPPVESANS